MQHQQGKGDEMQPDKRSGQDARCGGLMAETEQMPQEPLTEREHEIVALLAQGLSNQQIADQLYLTLDTVKWYNRQLFQKLGVHSRTQAVLSVRTAGLLGEAAAPVKHTLPEQGTRFSGREPELADRACRLLRRVGPAGIGKSRLVLAAARQALASEAAGVCLVPLAPPACFDAPTEPAEQRAALACLYESIGDLQAVASAHAAALAAFEQAVAHTEAHDYIRRARLYGKLAAVWVAMRRYAPGDEVFMRAEALLAQARTGTPPGGAKGCALRLRDPSYSFQETSLAW
jgi:DNA-binding CsgD family transcriptional regulator